MTQVLAIIGTLGVIASVVFAGWQSREVAKQTRIQNSLAGTSSMREAVNALHNVLGMMVEHPDLRPFFYEGQPCPAEGPLRGSVLAMAEMLADTAETGMLTHQQVLTTGSIDDWNNYVDLLVQNSPAMASIIDAHPVWYPLLAARRSALHRSDGT